MLHTTEDSEPGSSGLTVQPEIPIGDPRSTCDPSEMHEVGAEWNLNDPFNDLIGLSEGLGAEWDPNVPFNDFNDLIPLSEDVPCFVCGGTKDHVPGCMVDGKF